MSTHVCEITRPFGGFGQRHVTMIDGAAIVMEFDVDDDAAAQRLHDWWCDQC